MNPGLKLKGQMSARMKAIAARFQRKARIKKRRIVREIEILQMHIINVREELMHNPYKEDRAALRKSIVELRQDLASAMSERLTL